MSTKQLTPKQWNALKIKEQKLYEWFTAILKDSEIKNLNILIDLNIELEKECNQ